MTNFKAKTLALIALVGVFGLAVAAPADAAPYRGHPHGWHPAPRHYGHSRPYYRPGPAYVVAAPPPVVYAPPEPSPGINLILPLHFH